ncbi:MAG: hypothetical protein ABRQ39_17810 [Candidatus Eremiobacterota bacterium]
MSTIKSSTSKQAQKQQKLKQSEKSEKSGGGKQEGERITADDLKVELKGPPEIGIDKLGSDEAEEAGDKKEDKGKNDSSKKKVKSGVAGLV